MIHDDTVLQNSIVIIKKCDSCFITKCDTSLLQNASGFLLRNVTVLSQNATFITNCDSTPTKYKTDENYDQQKVLTIKNFYQSI